jgi:transcriptional regulator with XRE-family HTH domain
MSTQQHVHAHITIPADCLPLVAELVTRLGGNMADTAEGGFPAQPLPEVERGGKMLRSLRLRARMTQQAVADTLGLPQSHVSEFEKDRRAIPYKHALKLAELLHSIPSHFMTPNAETIAAMNEAGGDDRQTYDTPKAMYKDLGI